MEIDDNTFLKDEVVVMEDSPITRQTIEEVMSGLNWKVNIVDNADEAVAYAEKHEVAYYILDVHMGENREQEGIDALERIKKVNPNARVSILTAHPKYKRLAANIDKDVLFVEKTINLEEDIRKLEKEIRKTASGFLQSRLERLVEQEEQIRIQIDEINKDDNMIAYEQLILENYDEYKNKYVAFVDGELVGVADTEEEGEKLLEDLMTSLKYQDKSKFFTQVKKTDNLEVGEFEIIDLPSGYIFEDFDSF